MTGIIRQTLLICNHPDCSAQETSEGTAVYSLVHDPPKGWWVRENVGGTKAACPKHSKAAKAAEREHHTWAESRVAAGNAWLKKHPPPKAPAWLGL